MIFDFEKNFWCEVIFAAFSVEPEYDMGGGMLDTLLIFRANNAYWIFKKKFIGEACYILSFS